MPSAEPLPTAEELEKAFHAEVSAVTSVADTHVGGFYDHIAGPSALLFLRLAQRDRDEFKQIYFNHASGARLEQRIVQRFGRQRVLDTRGVGVATVSRATAAGGGGTILAGTRLAVGAGGASALRFLRVRTDRIVQPAETFVDDLQIESDIPGALGGIKGDRSSIQVLRFEDLLWDNTFSVLSIDCGAGTDYEKDPVYRANTRQEKFDNRPGYPTFIVNTCKAAGAANVVLFASDFLGADADDGLNRVYVGDDNFETSPALLLACRLAMSSAAIGGMSVQVLPMTNVALSLTLQIQMWDVAAKFPAAEIIADAKAAVVEYFKSRANPYLWKFNSIRGAILRAVRGVRNVNITASASEPSTSGMFLVSPLPRFRIDESHLLATVEDPSDA